MSDWSEATVIFFLEAYQVEECIWNPDHPNHKDRKKVNEGWLRISSLMNKTVKDLKNKKEILMTTFRRHIKKKKESIESADGTDGVYKPTWFAYNQMESFLAPLYTCTNTIKTERKRVSQETSEAEEAEEDEEDPPVQSTKPLISRRRPRPATALAEPMIAFGQSTTLTNRQSEQLPLPREDDECDLYSKLLAKKLREFPPDERKLLMYEIDTIFINRIKERQVRRRTPSPHCPDPLSQSP